MYLLGVLSARYYDFWVRTTATRPKVWANGISLAAVFLVFLLPFWVADWAFGVALIVFQISLVPAYFAATKHVDAEADKRQKALRQLNKTQKLIALGTRNKH